nr:MAG TPA: hypothetical protein [Caudoviricetes sp.]
MPVERDEYGCWTHPEHEKFCAGREYISTEEFDAWMIIFSGLFAVWMKMILIWTQMVPILPPGNRSDQRAKAGLLALFMTLKMVRFVSGCGRRLPHDPGAA